MARTLSTFYFDGTSFATATAVYTNATLTTLAPDGYYSNEVLVRQQLNGVLLNATTCTTCLMLHVIVELVQTLVVQVASLDVNVGDSTGAILIYGSYGTTYPDGQIATLILKHIID